MIESSMVLVFGNLLFEMGESAKAERYFDTTLILQISMTKKSLVYGLILVACID